MEMLVSLVHEQPNMQKSEGYSTVNLGAYLPVRVLLILHLSNTDCMGYYDEVLKPAVYCYTPGIM